MKPVSFIIQKLVSPLINKDNSYITKIIFNWPQIVGEGIAKLSYPAKVKKNQNTNILCINVSSSAIGAELHYLKTNILNKISFFLGENSAITDLEFKLELKKSKAQEGSFLLEELTSNADEVLDKKEFEAIKDLDLRENLIKLSNNVKKLK